MNDLFISVEYNYREIEGINNFKSSLERDYLCQVRPKWIPACSEGAELWITIFINSDIVDFLKNIIIAGVAWDLIKYAGKKYVFTPLFNALEALNKENESVWGGINTLKLKFQFDNCEVIIKGLNNNFTSVIPSVFNEITKKKPYFEREIGSHVIRIELPYNSDREEPVIETFLSQWKITFETEFPVMIYDFQNKELKDIQEFIN